MLWHQQSETVAREIGRDSDFQSACIHTHTKSELEEITNKKEIEKFKLWPQRQNMREKGNVEFLLLFVSLVVSSICPSR